MKDRSAIIHIGGSHLQLPSIRWAGEAGLQVILTDLNPDCPGRALADRFERISGTDVHSLLQLAGDVNRDHRLAGAYCSNDFGLPAVAAISETFSLPGPAVEAVRNALDKNRAREIWERKKLPIPKGALIKTVEKLEELTSGFDFPVIFKPLDSSGSRGVTSAWRNSEILGPFLNARKYSEAVLVEELVQGRHIDVNGLFIDGFFHPCGTLDRFFCDPPFHYPVWGCQPSSLEGPEEDRTYRLVEKAARALGIEDGPVKGDVVFTERGPVLLEVTPRFHGDVSTSFVTPEATGSSPVRSWFARLAGTFSPGSPAAAPPSSASGWMAIFPEAPGIFRSIEGIDSAIALNGVRKILSLKKDGTRIGDVRDNTSVCGFILVKCRDRGKVGKMLFKTRERLRVVSD